jgi:hypothetical protein
VSGGASNSSVPASPSSAASLSPVKQSGSASSAKPSESLSRPSWQSIVGGGGGSGAVDVKSAVTVRERSM